MLVPEGSQLLSKGRKNEKEMLSYEQILAEGLKPFVHELIMINGGVMIAYICSGQHANLADIIKSSTELVLKPGRVRYGNAATVDFDWGEAPSVTIAMEFLSPTLNASFAIILRRRTVGIDVRGIVFRDAVSDPDEQLKRFAEAVVDARIIPERRAEPPPTAA